MTLYLGKVKPGSTIYIPFASYSSAGASVTLTGLAATDIEVYKDGSVTQRASDNGYTLLDTDGIDFDSITGAHGFSIDLADNSTAGFWAAGSRYFVWVASVTIDSQTVNHLAAVFEIAVEGAMLNTTIATLSSQTSFTLTAGPAEDDALNGCVCYIHDVASAVQGGFAVVSDYTGSTKTVTLLAGTTFTAAATDNIGFFPPGNARWFAQLATVALPLTPTTAGRTLDVSAGGEAGVDWANVGSPTTTVGLSGTTVKTATDVETDTADIQTRLPAALVSGRIDASVGAMAANVLTATAINADAITAAKVAADVSAEIADAVWDEDATGHQTGGTFGQAIGDPGADTTTIYQSVVTDAAGTNVAADIIAVKAETAAILADTNELQTDWVDGGRLDLILDARASQTSVDDLPTNAELATALGTADDAVLAAIAALNNLSSSAAATAVLTTQMTEAYAANGVAPTLAQALFGIHQHLMTFAISGTSRTVKKLDGSTTAFVETLDDATTPTALTRA